MKLDINQLNLIYYRHNKYRTACKIAPNTINFYEVTLVFKGVLNYSIDGVRVEADSGDMIFLKKGCLREREQSVNSVDYVSFNITSTQGLDMPALIKNVADNNEIKIMVAACNEITARSQDYDQRILHLFCCIMLQIQDNIRALSANPLVEKIKKFINQNLSCKITLSDIGSKMFFSAVYCDTVFKKETGKSIIDYLIDERLTEAKRLLIEGSKSLKDIAESVGFNDYNYFSRIFKKRVGYTPSQYKKSLSY